MPKLIFMRRPEKRSLIARSMYIQFGIINTMKTKAIHCLSPCWLKVQCFKMLCLQMLVVLITLPWIHLETLKTELFSFRPLQQWTKEACHLSSALNMVFIIRPRRTEPNTCSYPILSVEEAFLRIAVEPSLGLGTGAHVWIMDD